MKTGILFLLFISVVNADAQSLKDLLYNGTLKSDSGTVVKKSDDLSTKIDTVKRKPVEPEKNKSVALTIDSIKKWTSQPDAASVIAIDKTDAKAVTKDNNKLWKEFLDSLTSTLKQEVLTSKKINKGDYYVTVDYTIAIDGQVGITNVLLLPENKFLGEQVKERISIDTPKLNPVLGGNGQPRKVVKRSNFTLNKN
ncbi:MAG: hypothetical protein ABIO81_01145 [Ginsengibacter sp.]